MRILLLCHDFNSLSQRLHVDLRRAGHEVTVDLDIHDDFTREAVVLFSPDLVIAPFLKRPIPADVWRGTLCLIVHPGIRGDRGPSALVLGDPRRRSDLGRHTDRASGGNGCGARLGLGGISDAPRSEVEPLLT
ncbi:hypothetical protein [Mesorhizobium onobrychidis]|uniref:hypothetical protein n=1 Tax=Mesorhizobium onobrychidis TaxID=2775404 RepID=UPI00215869F8|nr:hypothetical protein [Mesorhizobium onobrychidis]